MNIIHTIAVTFGSGAGGAAVAGYRDWRGRRRAMPDAQRNSGIITDRRARVLHAALIGCVTALTAWMLVFILVAVGKLPMWMLPLPYGV